MRQHPYGYCWHLHAAPGALNSFMINVVENAGGTPLYMMTQQKPSSKKDKKAKQNAVTAPVTAETEKPVANANGTPAENRNGKKAKGGKK